MSSWRRPVGAIVAITIVIEVAMALSGMGPAVAPVAAVAVFVGLAFWFVGDLASTAIGTSGLPVAPPDEPAARADRRVTQLRSGLAYGRADDVAQERLYATLVELIDDQLVSVHFIDRASNPAAARAVIGDELDVFVNDPRAARKLVQPRSLDRILTAIEKI